MQQSQQLLSQKQDITIEPKVDEVRVVCNQQTYSNQRLIINKQKDLFVQQSQQLICCKQPISIGTNREEIIVDFKSKLVK